MNREYIHLSVEQIFKQGEERDFNTRLDAFNYDEDFIEFWWDEEEDLTEEFSDAELELADVDREIYNFNDQIEELEREIEFLDVGIRELDNKIDEFHELVLAAENEWNESPKDKSLEEKFWDMDRDLDKMKDELSDLDFDRQDADRKYSIAKEELVEYQKDKYKLEDIIDKLDKRLAEWL